MAREVEFPRSNPEGVGEPVDGPACFTEVTRRDCHVGPLAGRVAVEAEEAAG